MEFRKGVKLSVEINPLKSSKDDRNSQFLQPVFLRNRNNKLLWRNFPIYFLLSPVFVKMKTGFIFPSGWGCLYEMQQN